MLELKLPEIGENITSGNVVTIFVSVGNFVKKNQDLLELETDKASLPVPSPCSGVIKEILIKEGDDVAVGSVIFKIDSDATQTEASTKESSSQKPVKVSHPTSTQAKPTAQPTHSTPYEKPSHVVVIGAGPGGYVGAFMGADLGLNITLIDKDINPGGVCLYRGCIPSKALLHAAKVLSEAKDAESFGITFGEPKIDLDKLRGWKDDVVKKLTGGLGGLTKARNINYIQGTATFVDSNTLTVAKADGTEETVKFDKAVLATGSSPIALPFAPKSKRVLDSTTALDLENIPQSMLLIGGGYIGLELGTVYAELGTKLDVVEMLPQIMTGADRDLVNIVSKRLKTILRDIMTETKVTAIEETDNGLKVSFEDKKGEAFSKEYEKILVAIGRRPNSKNLGLENTKVTVNDQGFVEVNAQRLTSDPSIFAIGDLAGQPMLAHKASHEAITAIETIAGKKAAFEPAAIPAVVFTDPEIAWCGITETEAKAQGVQYTVHKFPWAASGRAISLNRTDGLTKILVDPKTERVLGVAIVGVGAGELIAEGVLAIEMGAVAADLKMTIHPHPTLSETVMETAEDFYGHSIHIFKPKR